MFTAEKQVRTKGDHPVYSWRCSCCPLSVKKRRKQGIKETVEVTLKNVEVTLKNLIAKLLDEYIEDFSSATQQ